MKFYTVVSTYRHNGEVSITYGGAVMADSKPDTLSVDAIDMNIYVDYFDSETRARYYAAHAKDRLTA